MRVSELIAELQKCNPDAPVMCVRVNEDGDALAVMVDEVRHGFAWPTGEFGVQGFLPKRTHSFVVPVVMIGEGERGG